MEKKICSYETLFAVNGNLTEEDYQAIKEKFVTLINDNATDVAVAEWGKRRFAYPINYVTEGYYVLATFKSEPDFPLELERVLGITEGVLRYMTVSKSEKAGKATVVPAEEPAAEAVAEEAPAAEAVAEEAPAAEAVADEAPAAEAVAEENAQA